MRLLAISEYNTRVGSGYTTIARGLLRELEKRGQEFVVLALDYDGSQHDLRAAVVPADPQIVSKQLMMVRAGFRPEAVVVIADLTLHYALRFLQNSQETPYIGIFPIEADPLIHPTEWTNMIDTMHAALCESRFGTEMLAAVGIQARYFPVGVEEFWRSPGAEERRTARAQRNLDEAFVVLTIADNHERKNLPSHFAAVALLAGQSFRWPPEIGREVKLSKRLQVPGVHFVVNTKRRPEKLGYNTYALAERFGIGDRCMVMEHGPKEGLGREELRELYWCADALLLLSKAEGLGLPVLEAQACGVPVVGTDCTGIRENLQGGRGLLVPPEWVHIDPVENQLRRWADPHKAALALSGIAKRRPAAVVERGLQHAQGLTWSRAADVFEEALNAITGGAKAEAETAREADQVPA